MEIRCPSRIFAILRDGVFEVKCSSKHCGAGNGVAVFHYFDPLTGELIETKTFKDPKTLFDQSKQLERNLT